MPYFLPELSHAILLGCMGVSPEPDGNHGIRLQLFSDTKALAEITTTLPLLCILGTLVVCVATLRSAPEPGPWNTREALRQLLSVTTTSERDNIISGLVLSRLRGRGGVFYALELVSTSELKPGRGRILWTLNSGDITIFG